MTGSKTLLLWYQTESTSKNKQFYEYIFFIRAGDVHCDEVFKVGLIGDAIRMAGTKERM